MEWDLGDIRECATEIADICRKLHSHYLEKEDKLRSIKGLGEIDENIRKEGIRLETKMEEDEYGVAAGKMLLEENIGELFREAIACIGDNQ